MMFMAIGHLVSVPLSLLEASKSQESHFFGSLTLRYCWLKAVCSSGIRCICLRCGKRKSRHRFPQLENQIPNRATFDGPCKLMRTFPWVYALLYIQSPRVFIFSVSKLQNWMKKKSWFIEFLRVKTMMCEKYLTPTGHSERLIHWDFSTCYLDRRWFLHGSKRRGNAEIIFAK